MKILLAILTSSLLTAGSAAAQQLATRPARGHIVAFDAIPWGADHDEVTGWFGAPQQESPAGSDATWLFYRGKITDFLGSMPEQDVLLARLLGSSAALLMGVHARHGFVGATLFVRWQDPTTCYRFFYQLRAVLALEYPDVKPVDLPGKSLTQVPCDDFRAGRVASRDGPITFWSDTSSGALVEMSLDRADIKIVFRSKAFDEVWPKQ